MPIQMVDLKAQYQKIKSEVDAGIQEVIDTAMFINGPKVKSFQEHLERYLGVKHVIPCANGTDALQIAMMALLKPGDEVIVPAFTYVATAEVIALLGLQPVMVDVDPHTFNITAALVEPAITPRTKAIVPVHLFGQSVDMAPIMALAAKHGIHVIEDNAQAIGADYTLPDGSKAKTGTIGHIGCTSFFPSKNLGCYGDGGAIMTNDDHLAAQMRMVANHGQSRLYYHDAIGVNSRLDAIQAAVLDVKLRHLDAYCDARRAAADYYDSALAGVATTPHRAPYSTHVFHQYTLQVPGNDASTRRQLRDALKATLAEQGIPCMVYYPVPLYRQDAYKHWWDGQELLVTEHLCSSVFSLPMHTELDEATLGQITGAVRAFLQEA
jgi:UDP-2-acetamido-2-deoxy-ribo-hexuluronate aminotransferase